MFVAIGVGDTFAAIRLALDANAYTCHDDAPQLRHWIGRVTAAH
jgi:hypothetical protein